MNLNQEGVDGVPKGTQKHDSRFTAKAMAVLVNHVFKVSARLTWSSGMGSLKAERILSAEADKGAGGCELSAVMLHAARCVHQLPPHKQPGLFSQSF